LEKIKTIENRVDEKDYNVDENNQIIFEIDRTPYYGELSSGTYRIVKMARDSNAIIEFRSNGFIVEE